MNKLSSQTFYFSISILALICASRVTATKLGQSDTPKPCTPEQNYLFTETYKNHIASLGLTIEPAQVEASPCQAMVVSAKDMSTNTLIIKDLDLANKPCPLVVIYNSHKKQATIKAKDLMLPGMDVPCNTFFETESEEQRNSRIYKTINGRIFDLLEKSQSVYDVDLYSFYLSDLFDFDRVFRFRVISQIYNEFTSTNAFFEEYFADQVVWTFANLHDTYFNQFVSAISPKLKLDQYHQQLKSRLDYGGYFAAQTLWKTSAQIVRQLNLYTLQDAPQTKLAQIALGCCAYNVKELNRFMKHFVSSTFRDSDEHVQKREFKLKENRESMDVLMSEFESLLKELLFYFMQEKLIAHGISLLAKQGKFNWVISLVLHTYDSCGLESSVTQSLLSKAKKEHLLSAGYDQPFGYCARSSADDLSLYSFLFEVDFMEDSQSHKYCEIVFAIDPDGGIRVLPRTHISYIYYLPCDNQQNPSRFHLII